MEKLSTLDAAFLEVEDAVSHMHIGSIGIFEGPPPDARELRAMVAAKLPLVPRYRQVVRTVPLDMGHPVWVDDQHFNLDYHLRRTALPSPGAGPELRRLVGRVMSQQLDRGRPLWEMWAVEGLEGDRWGLISKIHHCMVDGIAGSDLVDRMLDREPFASDRTPEEWVPESPPSPARLLAVGLGETAAMPLRLVTAVLRTPRVLASGRDAAAGLLRLGATVKPPPTTSLNGPVGRNRRWGWARAQLDEIREIRAHLGGTVNDVVLACITGGLRRLLLVRGESVVGPIRTLVPVSVRQEDQHGECNNRVTAMFADLPVAIEDPAARLLAIHAHLLDLKASHEAEAGAALTSLGNYTAPVAVALGERLATRIPQRSVNTVTTNVPGPQYPLYACGRRMLEALPYVPLAGHVRLGIAIYSYDGACTFGVTADYDAADDIDVLCEGIESSLTELLAYASPAGAATAVR